MNPSIHETRVANRDVDTGITHDFVIVTGFSRKENGAMGPAEMSGDIGLMDFLVGVQDEQLVGLTFNEVMGHLRGVEYPLKLQFIRNKNMVPPDFEGWAQSYFPEFGDDDFHEVGRSHHSSTGDRLEGNSPIMIALLSFWTLS